MFLLLFYIMVSKQQTWHCGSENFVAVNYSTGVHHWYFVKHKYKIEIQHRTMIRKGITCKKILIEKSIEFGIPLK